MVRLIASGTFGSTNGMKWIYNTPSDGDIDADNDGAMNVVHGGLIDLSDLSSQLLGQQVSQHAKYTVRRILISLRNVDDAVDNDESTYFKGDVQMYYPSQHKLNALSLTRAAEKARESTEVDADSFFLSSENDYAGIRFGWEEDTPGNWESNQVRFQTSESFTSVPGTQWNLNQIFRIYDQMNPATKNNSLWAGRSGMWPQKITWAASNAMTGQPALASDWNSGHIGMKCLAGLIYLTVSDSAGNESGTTDDDYKLRVTVEYDVGVDA